MSGWRPEGFFPRPGGFRLGADPRPPRLVLLPGIEGDARAFLHQLPLSARRSVAALHLPTGDTIEGLAAGVAVQLPESSVVILGVSLGGLVGWALARQHPQRIAGLITLGTLPDPRIAPRRIGPAGRILLRLPEPLFAVLYRRRIAARLIEEGVSVEIQGRLLSLLPDRATLSQRLGAVSSWRPIGPPPVPALWLRGQVDHEIGWDSTTVRACLPGAGVEVVPGGHRAHITHPRPLHDIIEHFIASL